MLSDNELTEDDFPSDSEESEDEGSEDSEDDVVAESPSIQVAQLPEVLEPSIPIQKCAGIPYLMRHKGYRLCGDNIDKNVRTRHMRLESRNQSLHYFHLYAVENRVDFVSLSDEMPSNSHITDFRSVAKSLLPTLDDDKALKRNLSTLVSRALCTHLDFFKLSFDGQVKWHIQHRFYEEMSSKSVVVSMKLSSNVRVLL